MGHPNPGDYSCAYLEVFLSSVSNFNILFSYKKNEKEKLTKFTTAQEAPSLAIHLILTGVPSACICIMIRAYACIVLTTWILLYAPGCVLLRLLTLAHEMRSANSFILSPWAGAGLCCRAQYLVGQGSCSQFPAKYLVNPANTQRTYNVVQRCMKVIFTTLWKRHTSNVATT